MIKISIKQVEDLAGEGNKIADILLTSICSITSIRDRIEVMCELDEEKEKDPGCIDCWKVIIAWHQYTPANPDFVFTTHNTTHYVSSAMAAEFYGQTTLDLSKAFDAAMIASVMLDINQLG